MRKVKVELCTIVPDGVPALIEPTEFVKMLELYLKNISASPIVGAGIKVLSNLAYNDVTVPVYPTLNPADIAAYNQAEKAALSTMDNTLTSEGYTTG